MGYLLRFAAWFVGLTVLMIVCGFIYLRITNISFHISQYVFVPISVFSAFLAKKR
jgi:hypothetical protein